MRLFSKKPKLINDGAKDFALPEGVIEDPSQGGASIYRVELDSYRKAHIQQSVDAARRGVEPAAWHDGRIIFDHEFALAHSHQALRDRLQVWIRSDFSDEISEMGARATEVIAQQGRLEVADQRLIDAKRSYAEALARIQDGHEQIRFNSRRNPYAIFFKWLVAVIFVLSELLMTGYIFQGAIHLGFGGAAGEQILPFILAVGVMVMFVAGPHFLAKGLKLIDNSSSKDLEVEGPSKRTFLTRNSRISEAHLTRALWIFGASLILLMIPLSIMRAQGTIAGNRMLWFFLFFFVQLGVSAYFFVREWMDSGSPSEILHSAEKELGRERSNRDAEAEEYGFALSDFLEVANPCMKVVLDLFRHDGQIVEEFYATIHFGRSAMEAEAPSLRTFINGARIPYLGPRGEIEDERGLVYDAVSSSNRVHEEDGPRSRDWWAEMDWITKTMMESPGGSPFIVDELSIAWLHQYMKDNYGLMPYVIPPSVDKTENRESGGNE